MSAATEFVSIIVIVWCERLNLKIVYGRKDKVSF